jgi:hypothetical protein
MRRWLLAAITALAVLPVAAPVAAAEPKLREVRAVPLSDQALTRLQAAPAPVFLEQCAVGNLNPPTYAINNFLYPPEEYQLSFDPTPACGSCPVGFHVEQIHIALSFPSACSITLAANLTEPDLATSVDCPPPGAYLCDSQSYLVSVPAAGLYDVVLPVSCDCAFVRGYRYNLSVYFLQMVCNASLLTDNQPSLCSSWNNYGAGWDDLRATYQGWPGNLLIWADAACCEEPVPVGGATWGAIKSLYGADQE